jgi:hypothetical protein
VKKLIIALGVVLVVALVICLAPLKTVAYPVVVDYQDTEIYYEDEPYKDTETYYETEPYDVNTTEPLDYEVVKSYTEVVKVLYRDDELSGVPRVVGFGDPAPKGYVVVKNTDDVAGTFTIKFSFWAWDEFMAAFNMPLKNYQKGEVELYLKPSESGIAEFLAYRLDTYEDKEGGMKEFFDFDTWKPFYILYEPGGWSWEYEVTGTKTVTSTEYRQVEKQRTVTKYREVERQRTVIKQRPETRYKKITLLDYLLHY